MRNWVKSFKVNNLSDVNTKLYIDGDIFYTNRSVGILNNGKIKTVKSPDLSDYVKRNEVQQMIDDAINGGV